MKEKPIMFVHEEDSSVITAEVDGYGLTNMRENLDKIDECLWKCYSAILEVLKKTTTDDNLVLEDYIHYLLSEALAESCEARVITDALKKVFRMEE